MLNIYDFFVIRDWVWHSVYIRFVLSWARVRREDAVEEELGKWDAIKKWWRNGRSNGKSIFFYFPRTHTILWLRPTPTPNRYVLDMRSSMWTNVPYGIHTIGHISIFIRAKWQFGCGCACVWYEDICYCAIVSSPSATPTTWGVTRNDSDEDEREKKHLGNSPTTIALDSKWIREQIKPSISRYRDILHRKKPKHKIPCENCRGSMASLSNVCVLLFVLCVQMPPSFTLSQFCDIHKCETRSPLIKSLASNVCTCDAWW